MCGQRPLQARQARCWFALKCRRHEYVVKMYLILGELLGELLETLSTQRNQEKTGAEVAAQCTSRSLLHWLPKKRPFTVQGFAQRSPLGALFERYPAFKQFPTLTVAISVGSKREAANCSKVRLIVFKCL